MNDIAIQFDHVGKLYRLGAIGSGTLFRDLDRWWKVQVRHQEDPLQIVGEVNDRSKRGKSDSVWALKDITFDVHEGDVVGIIGRNGAGKSTLLKLLSRITAPTRGVIRARGRIASLLEVGTGFHGDLTGRENLYMNGAIMGMTRQEITRKLDEIVDFAGVARYLDTPVKRYSSGMTVRLGFAIAAFLDPEILVVDEVLAVGDAEFQKKAIGKMQNISQGEGRTVLFVSHNMAAVRSLCNQGVVLEKGQTTFMGTATEAIEQYMKGNENLMSQVSIVESIEWKKPYLTVTNIIINGTDKRFSTISSLQKTLDVVIEGTTTEEMTYDVKMTIKSVDNVPMATLAEGHYKGITETIPAGQFRIEKKIKLPKILAMGDYTVDLYLHNPDVEWILKVPHCTELHVEGYQESFGHPLRVREEGIIGLECCPNN